MSKIEPVINPSQRDGTIWIASFDIGSKNFAFYVEEIDKESLLKIENVDKIERYNNDGTPTKKMGHILNNICNNGKTILHKNSDLTNNCVKGKSLDPETFHNMTDLLDNYSYYWDRCSIFVIEQQMQFGKLRNPKAIKLGHHCQSYFIFKYSRFKHVIEFPAYHKTQVLGCQKIKGKTTKKGETRWKAVDKPQRKKWSVTKATEILENRGEIETINNLKTKTKKDDLADTLTQLQAFKYLYFVEKNL